MFIPESKVPVVLVDPFQVTKCFAAHPPAFYLASCTIVHCKTGPEYVLPSSRFSESGLFRMMLKINLAYQILQKLPKVNKQINKLFSKLSSRHPKIV